MKKRLSSWLLVLAMLLSLCPAMGITAGAEEKGTEIVGTTTIDTGGDYYLGKDVTGYIHITDYAKVTIRMNGHTLTRNNDGPVIEVDGSCKLTLIGEGGTITHTAGCTGSGIKCTGDTDIENCTITRNTAEYGGGIYYTGSNGIVIKNCTISDNQATDGSGGGVYASTSGYVVLKDTTVSGNSTTLYGGGIYHMIPGCVVAGTGIRMADGSEKAVEEIVEGDMVRTFDHEKGTVSAAKVYCAYKGETQRIPFRLSFAGGESISIVDRHDLLEKDSRKYVTLTEENAGEYIGKSFYGEDGQWHELKSVTKGTAPCDYYSIYTAGHQNVFANGLLTLPDDVDYLLNLYELDETLKADEARLAEDIQKYGLCTYEYANETCGVSREWYEDANTKYLFIAIGKGLMTLEQAEALYETTEDAKAQNTAVSSLLTARVTASASPNTGIPGLSSAMRLETIPSVPVIAEGGSANNDYVAGVLTLSGTTKVTGNTSNGSTSNVYLDNPNSARTSLIWIDSLATKDSVGVTLKDPGYGQFTKNGESTDTKYFFSDKDSYTVGYDYSGKYLKLGYKVTEETCTNGSVSVGNTTVYIPDDETVTVTATAISSGYIVDKVYYQPVGEEEVDITEAKEFTMPEKNVTVWATFRVKETKEGSVQYTIKNGKWDDCKNKRVQITFSDKSYADTNKLSARFPSVGDLAEGTFVFYVNVTKIPSGVTFQSATLVD